MGHPMKVSEAKTALGRAFLDLENVVMPREAFEAIKALLKSHEALRLAGQNLVGAFPPDMTGSGVVEFGADLDDLRALSLAVEDASK